MTWTWDWRRSPSPRSAIDVDFRELLEARMAGTRKSARQAIYAGLLFLFLGVVCVLVGWTTVAGIFFIICGIAILDSLRAVSELQAQIKQLRDEFDD